LNTQRKPTRDASMLKWLLVLMTFRSVKTILKKHINFSVMGKGINIQKKLTNLPRLEIVNIMHKKDITEAVNTTFKGVDSCVDAVEYLHNGKGVGKLIVTY
tara:strand:+ start:335 stop:637 length:303 start_codon:yes stop_codon:yes gene_type:complete